MAARRRRNPTSRHDLSDMGWYPMELYTEVRQRRSGGDPMRCEDGPAGGALVGALQRLWGVEPGFIWGSGADGYVCGVQSRTDLVVKITPKYEEALVTDVIMDAQRGPYKSVFQGLFARVEEAAVVMVENAPRNEVQEWYAVLRENATPLNDIGDDEEATFREAAADNATYGLQAAAQFAANGNLKNAKQRLQQVLVEIQTTFVDDWEEDPFFNRIYGDWYRITQLLAAVYKAGVYPADLHEGNWGMREFGAFAVANGGVGQQIIFDWGRSSRDRETWDGAVDLPHFKFAMNPPKRPARLKWSSSRWRTVKVKARKTSHRRRRGRG